MPWVHKALAQRHFVLRIWAAAGPQRSNTLIRVLTRIRVYTYLDRADTFLCELGVNMPKNRIRELRVKKGMSQKQLAEAAETSQQQIQRIEAGSQNARLEVAALICRALGAAMPEVFPTTELPLSRLAKRGRKLTDAYHDDAAVEELENAGIDMDIVVRDFCLSSPRRSRRLSTNFRKRVPPSLVSRSRRQSLGFAVFDSGSHRYAINLDHLLFCHFLFDAPFVADGVASGDKESDYKVKFYLLDSPKPHVFVFIRTRIPLTTRRWSGGRTSNFKTCSFMQSQAPSNASSSRMRTEKRRSSVRLMS